MFPSEKAQRDLDRGAKYIKEKPVALYKTLLSLYGHPNCWILDLYSGAGKICPRGYGMVVFTKPEDSSLNVISQFNGRMPILR